MLSTQAERCSVFLSTLSLRRATQQPPGENLQKEISIHALLAESDVVLRRNADGQPYISIHALLAESDQFLARGGYAFGKFLSTLSLRRATHFLAGVRVFRGYFYPRSPCGERRSANLSSGKSITISIHALLAESDQFLRGIYHFSNDISIHALLAESDDIAFFHVHSSFTFLSTLSLRRATIV